MKSKLTSRLFLLAAATLLPLCFTPAHAQPMPPPFVMATGSAPAEVIIPEVIPVLFSTVSPGDATLILRTTTLLTQSWFDAIAPYGETTVGVSSRLGRRPPAERTDANRNVAILYASFRMLNSLYPSYRANWRAMLSRVGLDPDNASVNPTTAIGLGNLAGNAVVAARENDGMNQLGNESGTGPDRRYNRRRYADYTGYRPVNTAYEIHDPSRWQPNIVENGYGIFRVQQFVTPQYARVQPYSYPTPIVFRAPKPVASDVRNFAAYKQQVDEVLAASAGMTDRQKMIAELFDNKITSLGFSALFASVSNQLSLEEFVWYDFLTNLAAFDTGIAIWQEKARYDAVRPFTAVCHVYGNRRITAWGGPGRGTVTDLPASEWRAYLPVADHPEYPSGSASFCAAHAQASRRFFLTDTLNWSFPVPRGTSVIEPGFTPQADLVLNFATWTQFAEECGQSRFWAGVHFKSAIPAGRDIGHRIGDRAYDFLSRHIMGTATPPAAHD
jgi:hypothetical protein